MSSRRTFLGNAARMGAGLAAGLALSPAPWEGVADLTRLGQDPPWLPDLPKGPLERVDTTSLACPSGMGVSVFLAKGRPVLTRGNPEHPLSRGTATVRALSEVRDLHHPGRVLTPLLRNAKGEFEPVSWAAALGLLAGKLAEAGGDVMAVGDCRAGALQALLGSFLRGLGSDRLFRMPSEAQAASDAVRLMGGTGQPGYDLDNAAGLLALGADVFGAMPAAPHFMRSLAPRPGLPVYFGPERAATASLCREWHPLPWGGEAALAMGIAGELARLGQVRGDARDLGDFLALARQRFGPQEVQAMTGVSPQALRQAALAVAAGALPVVGSPCGRGLGNAPFVAGLALSVLTGRINRPGGVWLARPPVEEAVDPTPAPDLLSHLKDVAVGLANAPAVLLLVEADPAAELAEPALAARGLCRAGFRAAMARTLTASARLCDLVLPAPMPLERWDDVATPYGLAFAAYGLARPLAVTRPLARTDARHPGDVLIDLAARLGRPLGASSFKQVLRRVVSSLEERGGYVADAVPPWEVLAGKPRPAPESGLWEALEAGRLWADTSPAPGGLSCGARFLAQALAPAVVELNSPLALVLRAGPEDASVEGGLLAARLNAATADRVRVKEDGRVRLIGPSGSVEALVVLDESVMDGHVSLPLGRAALAAASALAEPASGVQAFAGCRVRVERA